MNNRTSLTKSLHTVSVLVAVARHLMTSPAWMASKTDYANGVRHALGVLNMSTSWPDSDPVFAAAVARLTKGVRS